jgi:hypothetical protein
MQPGIPISCNLNLETLLKTFLLHTVLLTTTATASLYAQAPAAPVPTSNTQANPIAVTGSQKDSIDLHFTKLQNIQLQAKDLQIQYKQSEEQLQSSYLDEQKSYKEAVEKAKTDLKVPANATFDPKTFTFTPVPTKVTVNKPEVKK